MTKQQREYITCLITTLFKAKLMQVSECKYYDRNSTINPEQVYWETWQEDFDFDYMFHDNTACFGIFSETYSGDINLESDTLEKAIATICSVL